MPEDNEDNTSIHLKQKNEVIDYRNANVDIKAGQNQLKIKKKVIKVMH
jgi:hypothetical protein